MASRRLYAVLGIVCGFVLIDYGFNFIAVGLPGARELTSQFTGGSLAIGGSASVFVSLYSLLSSTVTPKAEATPGPLPDVSAEIIAEEETGPQYGFYKHIEHVGYFFTALGLFSAADLILQVFIHQLYDETRWWIEVLLVTFGVLSYAIFGSIGRIGAQEERAMASRIEPPAAPVAAVEQVGVTQTDTPQIPETIQFQLTEFVKSTSGDYEHHISGRVYDLFRVQSDVVTVWREDRQEMRSVYLAGPYELTRSFLEGQLRRGEDLRIGILTLPVNMIQELLKLQPEALPASASS